MMRTSSRLAKCGTLLFILILLFSTAVMAQSTNSIYESNPDARMDASVAESAYGQAIPSEQGSFQIVLDAEAAPKREFRGAWIATVSNIDWPSNRYSSKEAQQQELSALLDSLQEIGINAILFQVKPSADALYDSDILPWSEWLTGTQGQDPGYDPLAFAIEEAHKRNMEFHAWVNPYRANTRPDMTGLIANHPIRTMEEGWVVPYNTGLYFNPGVEGVRRFITETIMEIVNKYDIDGIHMDDYFYPYPSGALEFDDEETYEANKGEFTDKGDWRRNNVNLFVQQLAQEIEAAKPDLQFGISPFGIWRNAATDPTGSPTSGLEAYDAVFADSRAWIQNEWIDYIAPQIYWSTEMAVADYNKLVDWWANEVSGTDVQLYIGQAAYKINNNSDPQWTNPDELINQIRHNRTQEEVQGGIFYSTRPLLANPLGILDNIKSTVFKYPALIPARNGSMVQLPEVPEKVGVLVLPEGGIQLSWEDTSTANDYYVVYRVGEDGVVDLSDPAMIEAIVRRTDDGMTQSHIAMDVDPDTTNGYVVTAVNRLHEESEPSNPALVNEGSEVIAEDVNGDGVISIGDIGILRSLLGKNSDDPDWDLFEHLDFDKNARIDLEDLKQVARLILERVP